MAEPQAELESTELIRECIFSMRGFSGRVVQFDGAKIRVHEPESMKLQESSLQRRMGSGSSQALRLLAEAGWLYMRVKEFIAKVKNSKCGCIERALSTALSSELTTYHELLCHLEASAGSLSLRQLLVLSRPAMRRLYYLAILADRTVSGPHLLRDLNQQLAHGDPRFVDMVQSLLMQAAAPWWDMLYLWTTTGKIADPAEEFFISEEPTGDLWSDCFKFLDHKCPEGLLDNDLFYVSYTIGKGINYIRHCLGDGKWGLDMSQLVEEKSNQPGSDLKTELGFAYRARETKVTIRDSLQRMASMVHSHILDSLHNEHNLFQHLFALKQFLLLGQGDFFAALMDGIHDERTKQRNGEEIYKHNLSAIVDTALLSTNAAMLPQEVLGRLEVELLPDLRETEDEEEEIWDMFVLDYEVPEPLRAIVHAGAIAEYKKLFMFLFGLRKIEFLLNLTWRQSAALQHALQTSAQYNNLNVSTSPEYAQSTILLRHVAMTRQTMMHFVGNLKSYLMFEVLEGVWKEMEVTVVNATTLDDVIGAHDKYLNDLLRKALLPDTGLRREEASLGSYIEQLLLLVSDFCSYQEILFGLAIQEAEIAAEKRREAVCRQNQGEWGFNIENDDREEITFFGLAEPEKIVEVDRLADSFRMKMLSFLDMLDSKLHGGSEKETTTPMTPMKATKVNSDDIASRDDLSALRFLALQLDSNGYYSALKAT